MLVLFSSALGNMGSIGNTINMKCEEPSDIDVLIVGAGLGGLYAAIDFHRQGHAVVVVESKKEVEALGRSSSSYTQAGKR